MQALTSVLRSAPRLFVPSWHLPFSAPLSTMSAPQENTHPIQASDWHKAYPAPSDRSSKPLLQLDPTELQERTKGQTAGKDYVIVDVRRADCEVSTLLLLLLQRSGFLTNLLLLDSHPRCHQPACPLSSWHASDARKCAGSHPSGRLPLQPVEWQGPQGSRLVRGCSRGDLAGSRVGSRACRYSQGRYQGLGGRVWTRQRPGPRQAYTGRYTYYSPSLIHLL